MALRTRLSPGLPLSDRAHDITFFGAFFHTVTYFTLSNFRSEFITIRQEWIPDFMNPGWMVMESLENSSLRYPEGARECRNEAIFKCLIFPINTALLRSFSLQGIQAHESTMILIFGFYRSIQPGFQRRNIACEFLLNGAVWPLHLALRDSIGPRTCLVHYQILIEQEVIANFH